MKKQVDLIFLSFMLFISSIIAGDVDPDKVLHSNSVEFEKFHDNFQPNAREKYKHYNDAEGEEGKMTVRVQHGDEDKVLHSNSVEFEKFHGNFQPNARKKYKHYNDAEGEERKMTTRVHPGAFFREKMLTKGVMTQMVDISDNLPKMSFLPENILAKLSPFSTSNIDKMMKVLSNNVSVSEYARVKKMMRESLAECEDRAAPGEKKQCVKSTKEMVQFVTSVLGNNVVARRTENVNGSGKTVVIGKVSKLNGGNVTLPITCHKHLFPYMLVYYCHSNPMVRLYQVDLLEPKNKEKINQAIAICHVDTTSWSSDHPAFQTLGFGPGLIEACHWVFENEFSWAKADD